MYKSIAKYYDLLGWGEFHDVSWPRLRPQLEKNHSESYLDLACGTGSLAFTVSRLGIDVVGLDKSTEMLQMAARRLRLFSGKMKPRFTRGNMTRFDLGRQFDAVGCFYDAANHILSEGGFFNFVKSAARHLKPGGFFIFDVNTAAGLRHWDAVLFSERGKHALLMKGSYDRHTRFASVTITGFVSLSGGKKDKFRETFHEKCYPHKYIMSCLKKAGFRDIEASPSKAGSTLRNTGRVFYTAYKIGCPAGGK
jgi:SAM-dependent methyltransferase